MATTTSFLQRSIPRWLHNHQYHRAASSQRQRQRRQLLLRSSSSSCSTNNDIITPGFRCFSSTATNFAATKKKVAIVGSGPSGCYTAKYLQSAWKQQQQQQQQQQQNNNDNDEKNETDTDNNGTTTLHIDILERLPTAYGLVRNGVAPDHPEVKNVQHDFDKLLSNSDDDDNNNIEWFGNVQVGKDVSLQELRELYDIVVLAYGCESDRSFNLNNNNNNNNMEEGAQQQQQQQEFKGILSAREFVNWYNGHVDFGWVGDVVHEALNKTKKEDGNTTAIMSNSIVVIGHGNVALDCARILAKEKDELDPTDIATRSLNVIRDDVDDVDDIDSTRRRRRTIQILGRRGHVQAAFTIKEVRELTKLPNADFVVLPEELEAGLATEASQHELEGSRPKTRIDKLLAKQAASKVTTTTTTTTTSNNNDTQVNLRFLMNPIRFESDDGHTLARVICERTELTGEAGRQTAQGTGVEEAFSADLVRVG
jgi:adrenodoxin-NADP+ reductase